MSCIKETIMHKNNKAKLPHLHGTKYKGKLVPILNSENVNKNQYI